MDKSFEEALYGVGTVEAWSEVKLCSSPIEDDGMKSRMSSACSCRTSDYRCVST